MRQRTTEVLVKKYANRRLYDTAASRYITLDELAEIIRGGRDVRIVDAKSNVDLTQVTLAQMILENGRTARLLPLPLLIQLVRMSDDALAEFFGRYMTWALGLYQQAKSGAEAMAPFNPFATLPFAATNVLARLWGNVPGQPPVAAPESAWHPPPAKRGVHDGAPPDQSDEAPLHGPAAPFDDSSRDPDLREESKREAAKTAPKERGEDAIAELRREVAELRRAVLDRK